MQAAVRQEQQRIAQAEAELNQNLLKKLKELRLKLARQLGVPAFVIFTDATLRAMCVAMPQNETEFLQVSGVGKKKWEQYGQQFLLVLQEWRNM